MTKVTVLHIVEDLQIGGLEKIIATIVLGLDKEKYQTVVWCLTSGGEIAEELIDKGITVRILGMDSYYNPLKIIGLSSLIKKNSVNIVHTHGYFASTFGRLASIVARTPVVITHIHTTYYGFKRRNILIERFLSLFTDKIVCVSQAVHKFVVEVEGINQKKTCLIYNGVGTSPLFEDHRDADINRKSFGFEKNDFVVIIVASLTPHKGHHVLIDAVRIALERHENLRLLIVGDGPLRDKLEAYVKELQLSSKMVFAGRRKDSTLLLKLADLFVLPSTEREGLGMALLEAMAEGLPVIGSNVGGIPEVIEDTVNGFLVAPGDSYGLAAAIEKLATDKVMRNRMGTMGRTIYKRKFTLEKMNQNIEALYDGIVKGRRK